ncbi:MAG: SBBP repeat-containing protein [Candidatus Tectomicrobia bacterium]|uniref:SBBP repeat-containing protein n=1 Tax=Tectimicrobiota bacterium TaxID=2528274 RepID=A0A932CPN0_UNCTE|nr:SBBP repeat-containing protein [Candidatus Tectomicrobia bacterium]
MKGERKDRRSGMVRSGLVLLLAVGLNLFGHEMLLLGGRVCWLAVPSAGMAALVPLLRAEAAPRPQVNQAYGKLPSYFEANRGQTDPRVQFLSRGSGYSLSLTPAEAILSLGQGSRGLGTMLRMHFLGAQPAPQMEGILPLPGKSHYFLGDDSSQWRTGVPHYARVKYRGIYPGIDLVFYGKHRQLEYDFIVAPGVDPKAIRLGFEGTDPVGLDDEGNLVLDTAGGKLVQRAPVIYQDVNGTRRTVAGRYRLLGSKARDSGLGIQEVGFEVAAYDPTQPLVIDPVLEYATYLGGSKDDQGLGIAVDASGHAYVTGWTRSVNFPTAAPLQPASGGLSDLLVARLSPDGATLLYATYLGGSKDEQGLGIAVDASGHAYVTGWTSSTNFPTVSPLQPASGGLSDLLVARLSPDGATLLYATYLGGSGRDEGKGIALDGVGNIHLVGMTQSSNFPTAAPLQPTSGGLSDLLVAKLSPDGAALLYATYLGGSKDEQGLGIAVDASGHAYMVGVTQSSNFPTVAPLQPAFGGGFSDALVAKLSPDGTALLYATYLGGKETDGGLGIAVDASGHAYVTGATQSPDFPLVRPFQSALGGKAYDAFVARLSPDGTALLYATYLGGKDVDGGLAIAVDTSGHAYVTGGTQSPDFPLVRPFQPALGGKTYDAFVARLSPDGAALLYATYLGGKGADGGFGIAVDASGNAYVTGNTASSNFPTVNPRQPVFGGISDAFIFKIVDVEPVEPFLSITPSSLDFGHVSVGGWVDKSFTVQNLGADTLIGSADTSAPYSIVSGGSYSLTRGQSQPVTVRFSPSSAGASPGNVAFTGEEGKTVAVTGTGVVQALVHDLAVTRITVPKKVTLTAKRPAQNVQIKVQVQNRSPHPETIQDTTMLDNLVSLSVESLWTCPAPTPALRSGSPQKALPLTLKPKQTLEVIFDLTLDCANDRAPSTPSDPGHEDYRYSATVNRVVLDGEADSHPADDLCPRSVTPPFEVDPNPDGRIKDKGCGGPKADGTLGAEVLTDVVSQ